jgi:signal transduction histidine kinase
MLSIVFQVCLMAQSSATDGLVLHFSAMRPGVDLSGNNNNGLWHDVTTTTGIPGVSDSALYFDGSDSYIEIRPFLSLQHSRSSTIAFWCLPEAVPAVLKIFFLVVHRNQANVSLMGILLSSGGFYFNQTDWRKDVSAGSGKRSFPKKNTWYHIAGVFDADKQEIRIYQNGYLTGSHTTDLIPKAPTETPLMVGSDFLNGQPSGFFKGRMEDIRIYNRALSGAEILALTHGFAFANPDDVFEKKERLEQGRYVMQKLDRNGAADSPLEIAEILSVEVFWKKPWFLACCLAIAILLTFSIVHLYNRRIQQKQVLEFEQLQMLEHERFRIARVMHDDIGSGLSAINLLTEMVLNKNTDPGLATEIMHIAEASRDANNRIQEIIWSISAHNDTLISLLRYLQRFAADLFLPTGIVLQLHIPSEIYTVAITGERRRALFLAYKEALNNILKHAQATAVGITISVDEKMIEIQIQDNGTGFDPEAVGAFSNGLVNMRKRMEETGGDFRIQTGHGTLVVFRMPII